MWYFVIFLYTYGSCFIVITWRKVVVCHDTTELLREQWALPATWVLRRVWIESSDKLHIHLTHFLLSVTDFIRPAVPWKYGFLLHTSTRTSKIKVIKGYVHALQKYCRYNVIPLHKTHGVIALHPMYTWNKIECRNNSFFHIDRSEFFDVSKSTNNAIPYIANGVITFSRESSCS